MPDAALAITPDSKLGDLLARWPELEAVLIEISPHFRALRNPVLRRTVAKVATLRQVAQVSGVSLGVLVERLRAAVGAPPGADAGDAQAGSMAASGRFATAADAPRPDWASAVHVSRSHDARAAIEAGEHPLPAVMRDLAELGDGDVYELVTPFVPAPLVDIARSKGFEAHSVVEQEGLVRTYFRRGAPQ